jgi:drug/metabolite transporter (DMT)-like permease
MGLMSLQAGGRSSFSGDLLALLTTLFFSAYLLMGQSIRKNMPAGLYMVLLYGSCTVFLFLAALMSGQSLIPADLRIIGICALLTLSATFLVHSVYNWSVSHVGALFITIITLTEPVGATLVGWFLFREIPSPVSLLGGLLIMGGILWFLSRQYGPTGPVKKL